MKKNKKYNLKIHNIKYAIISFRIAETTAISYNLCSKELEMAILRPFPSITMATSLHGNHLMLSCIFIYQRVSNMKYEENQ